MSFRLDCWRRGVWARLSGQRPGSTGPAVRYKVKPQDSTQDADVLPHADPAQWRASYKTGLNNCVNIGAWRYQACHSVSDVGVNVAHFRTSGLIPYKAYPNGSAPCNYYPIR